MKLFQNARLRSRKISKNFQIIGDVQFPEPTGVRVNMLPFIPGDIDSLPENLQQYFGMITSCNLSDEEKNKVCFLTVDESFVKAGETQRRGGVHVEMDATGIGWGGGGWGRGIRNELGQIDGGLYLASTVSGTTAFWDRREEGVLTNEQVGSPDLISRANQLVWMTDRTPHEALPQENDGYRQFFRLCTSEVGLWYSKHSTANPRVRLPENIIVLDHDKFLATA